MLKELLLRWGLPMADFHKKILGIVAWVFGVAASLHVSHLAGAINLTDYSLFGIVLYDVVVKIEGFSVLYAIFAKTTVKPIVPAQELQDLKKTQDLAEAEKIKSKNEA